MDHNSTEPDSAGELTAPDRAFRLSPLEIMASRYGLLTDIARDLIREMSIERVAEAAIGRLGAMVSFERCSLALVTGDGEHYDLMVRSERRPGLSTASIPKVAVDSGIAGRAMQGRRVVYLPDMSGPDSRIGVVDEPMEGGSLRSLLGVPLIASGEVLGALNLGSDRPDAWSSTDLKMVRQVAAMLALAIERHRAKVRLEQTVASLESSNAELDGFIYAASHDLRSPLLSVKGLVQLARLARETGRLEELDGLFDRMERSVDRLDGTVVDILQTSRARREVGQIGPVDVLALVEDVLDAHSGIVPGPEIKLCFDVAHLSALRSFPTDRSRLHQAVNNLVSNAVKYCEPERADARVEVRICAAETNLRIEVADNGPGVAPELRSRIFEMFYRGTARSTGAGLGLYLVAQHAAALHGQLALDDASPGACFRLVIPPAV